MCGICGIVNFERDKRVDPDVVKRMTDILIHRGPDDEGVYLNGNCGLGFRRLSIIDVAAGHQPMCNENGDVWIVFNGEIYNHAEIRAELIAKGHTYKTRSDTETIIHLYEEEGIDGFKKMNGMFGFAIWDASKNKLILARDRLGIKPVHYTLSDGSLIFASEIKAILQNQNVKAELRETGLEEQLVFRFNAGANSLFKNIQDLLPGHILVLEDGKMRITKFWDISLPEGYLDIDEQTAIDELEERLRDSVRLRLMSDVPLGTFCSGGVDSGLTTAYASESSNFMLNTFSVGFHENGWDETPYARLMSQKYQTSHHIIKIDNKTYADSLPQLIWHHDTPIYHPSSILIYYLSKLAKEHVTVVLTGEGADELFGGYPRLLIPREYSRLRLTPRFLKKALKALIAQLPNRKLNKLAYFLPLSLAEVAGYNSSYVTPELVRSVLNNTNGRSILEYRLSVLSERELNYKNLVESTMLMDLKNYIPSLLHRQDKMSMAASIESRVPFLDYRLVEWAMKIPLHYKIKNMGNKYIVKKLAEKKLPRRTIYRQKVGFGVPVADWLRDKKGLGRYLQLLSEPSCNQRRYLNTKRVKQLIIEHVSGKSNHCEILWNLINLEIWHRIFIDKSIEPNATALNQL